MKGLQNDSAAQALGLPEEMQDLIADNIHKILFFFNDLVDNGQEEKVK